MIFSVKLCDLLGTPRVVHFYAKRFLLGAHALIIRMSLSVDCALWLEFEHVTGEPSKYIASRTYC